MTRTHRPADRSERRRTQLVYRAQVLGVLAAGGRYSARALARALGLPRRSINATLAGLRREHAPIIRGRAGSCHRVTRVEQLDPERIRRSCARFGGARLRRIDCLAVTDSTNEHLRSLAGRGDIHAVACTAELQTAGRGRRARRWIAPPGGSLCLSVAWRYALPAQALVPLGLAISTAVASALERQGARGIGLKWPNDLMHEGRKLGGILVELTPPRAGAVYAIAGIGLNVNLDAASRRAIDQPCTDLRAAFRQLPTRNQLAAVTLHAVLEALARFGRDGLAPALAVFRAHDVLRGRTIRIVTDAGTIEGHAADIDEGGALEVVVDGVARRVVAGEVSVRLHD